MIVRLRLTFVKLQPDFFIFHRAVLRGIFGPQNDINKT